MFKKILIANRGEIACRVIKTCSLMGIKTVAVFSEADRNALHVQMANEAIFIGASQVEKSYLSIDKIVNACRESGAEAVHPGYGFLSENSNFCNSLIKEGITFIGPPAFAIESMGDKIASKKIAVDAGVSIIPGFLGIIKDEKSAVKIANDIGYPVMIKASAGGGGKGMRIARDSNEVIEGFAVSKNEAKKSFGDDRIFIEKYIEKPRHIEIQILGDTQGHYVFFGERECSIQRRNQKIIEEAPSPFISKTIRNKMGKEAIALAKAVGYFSAGTVEFIVDSEQKFYFLEMNTRLQVEHPVTELIYGVDLVKEMINIAAMKPISYSQNDIKINGAAIESRIYAEDPERNFLPSVGRINRYLPPDEIFSEGLKLRNDSGVYEGAEIGLHYDPMIAKLCVWSPNRKMAIEKMQEALDCYTIDGVQTNIGFLSTVMANKKFVSGKFSTSFIAEEFPRGLEYIPPNRELSKNFGIIASCLEEFQSFRLRKSFRPTVQISKRQLSRIVLVSDIKFELNFKRLSLNTFVFDDNVGNEIKVELSWHPGDPLVFASIGGVKLKLKIELENGAFQFEYRGHKGKVKVFNPKEAVFSKFMKDRMPEDVSKFVLCPMPGLLVDLRVSVGEKVSIGQPLCVIEAMKMENILRAEKNQTIKTINKKLGDPLRVDDVIMEFD